MYNIYTEEKKISKVDQKIKEEQEAKKNNEKHKLITNNLVNNYQKKIKKFIIDVRNKIFLYIIFITIL